MYAQRFEETRAVSPVIGVVLMVAITVLLAATAASFFVGVGNSALGERSPTVAVDHTFDVDGGSHELTLSHAGGDRVRADAVRVVVAGADCSVGPVPEGRYAPGDLGNGADELSAGAVLTLSADTLCRAGADLDLSSAEVTVVWVGTDGSTSNTLWRWRGPSA